MLDKFGQGDTVRRDNRIVGMVGHGTYGQDRNAIPPGYGAIDGKINQIVGQCVEYHCSTDALLADVVHPP